MESRDLYEQYRSAAPPLLPIFDTQDEDTKLKSYVEERVNACERVKSGIVKEAWKNLSFLSGDQWAQWNDYARQMMQDDSDDGWRVQLVYNYTRSIVNQLASRLTENRPVPIVHPATDNEEDQHRARLCEKLIEHLWRVQKMSRRHHEFVLWMLATGVGIYKVFWRQDHQVQAFEGGPDELDDRVLDQYGQAVMTAGKPGIPVAEVLSLFEFGWDIGARNFETCRWMYHTTTVHVDELVERYPRRGPHAKPDSPAAHNHFGMSLLRTYQSSEKLESPLRDRVSLIEYFELPSKRYPKGLFIVKASNVLLHVCDLPFGFLPFITARHNVIPGKMTGDGAVKDLRAPQRQVNTKESQRVENANLMAQPKWIVAEGSIAGDYIDDEPGEVVKYDPSLPPPRQTGSPPLSPEHGSIAREAVAHMFELAGINDLARGRIPAGMSGRAVGMAADLEATLLGPVVREAEGAIEDLGRMWLRMYHRMSPPSRTLSIVGRSRISEVVAFHGEDITSTDVEVMAGSSLPNNRSHRREQVLMVANSGWLGDPADPKVQLKVRRLLEFDGMDEIFGDNTADRRHARDEQTILLRAFNEGQPFPLEVLPNDGHAEHADEHDAFTKSPEFRTLTPEYKLALLQHLAWHKRYQQREQMGIPWFAEQLKDELPPEELALYDPQFQQEQQQPPQEGPPQEGQMPPDERNMMLEQAMGPTPNPMEAPPPGPAQPEGLDPQLAAMIEAMQMQQQAQTPGVPESMAGLHGPGRGNYEFYSE